ncbi:MAG: PAS sensor protein [Bacteroidales bacterium]|nr:PAS sensor protein [Bacteroidales bacterium]MDY3912153.1 PAS sensor protein [Sodaliphilus sp.]
MMEFDCFEHVGFSATVCDAHGVVVYQNAESRNADGDAVGRNMMGCHSERSQAMIRAMLASGRPRTYEIITHGQRKLVHHTPWRRQPGGEVAGLIELVIPMPDNHPTFDRDAQQRQKQESDTDF